jgi:hypothetical protein
MAPRTLKYRDAIQTINTNALDDYGMQQAILEYGAAAGTQIKDWDASG